MKPVEPCICGSRRQHRRLEGHPFLVSHNQDWGRGFNLLLPQAAVLPRSDAGRDGVEPTLNSVI